MRIVIAFLLLCSVATGQSFVIPGGDTFAVNGRLTAVESAVTTLQADVAGIRSDVSEIKSSIASMSQPKPVTQEPAKPTVKRREWYLVSEPWCSHCPAARARFIAKGWPRENIITMAECQRRFGFSPETVPFEFGEPVASQPAIAAVVTRPVQVRQRLPVVQTQWGRIDLETYNRNCNCPMCQGIRAMQSQYRSQYSVPPEVLQPVKPEQEPTPTDVMPQVMDALDLQPDDVYADLGCGDGRLLIEAVRRSGCRGVGIEIDPEMAETARRRVQDSGLSDRIAIVTGDACNFRPEVYGVTKISAYLYPQTLAKLAAVMAQAKIAASPYHEVEGLAGEKVGDVWVYRMH